MIEITALGPADQPDEPTRLENAFLWCAEAKPLSPVNPSDDNVQEILIFKGTDDELLLTFDISEEDLDERVAGVCNSLFVESGMDGVSAFGRAIADTGIPYPYLTMPQIPQEQDVRGEKLYINDAASPRRAALKKSVQTWYDKLGTFREKVLPKVQVAAAAYASTKLERSLDETLRQSLRYFRNLGPRGDTGSGSLVPQGTALSGPDVTDLAMAMQRVAILRGDVSQFAKAVNRNVGLVDSQTALIGPQLLNAGARRDLRALLGVALDPDGLVQATRGLQGASQQFAKECALLCRVHPILYRLLDNPIIFKVDQLLRSTPATDVQQALQGFVPLRSLVSTTLNDTTSAANALIADLRAHPEDVWTYDRAIEGGLSTLHLSEGDLAWHVAQENIKQRKTTTLGLLNEGLNSAEMVAALMGVAPPVTVALAAIGVLSSVASLIEDALTEVAKDRALSACLNPADSLVFEGGSYFGVVFGALFILASVRGVVKDLAKAVGVR